MQLSIVIPIFNEAESLAELFVELELAFAKFQSYEVICIDDGSTDDTFKVLRLEQSKHPEIRIIKFKKNAGQSDALNAGFRAAQGEIVATLDADLQNPPAELLRLVEAMDNCDCVIGWRADRRGTASKRFASRVANAVRGGLLKDNAHDSACSLKVFRREYVQDLIMFKGMHRFMPALLAMRGAVVKEVQVQDRERSYGISKYGTFARGIPGFFDLLAVLWMRKRKLTYEVESTN